MDKELTANPRPTWEAMEKLHKSGKAKAIGVSNWTIKGLESLLEYAKVVPAVNQVEVSYMTCSYIHQNITPLLHRVQTTSKN